MGATWEGGVIYWLGAATLLASSLIALTLVWLDVRMFGLRPVNLLIGVLILLDSAGLALLPFLENLPLPYLPEAKSAYTLSTNREDAYFSHVASHLLIQVLLLIYLLASKPHKSVLLKRGIRSLLRRAIQVGFWLAVPLALFFYVKYFFLGPGMELLQGLRLSYADTTEAVTARSLASSQVESGQGAFGAQIAAFVVWPWLTILLLQKVRSGLFFWPMWGILWLLSTAYALQTYQKAPVLAVALIYLSIALSRRAQFRRMTRSRQRLGRRQSIVFSIAVLGGFLGSVLLYSINFGLSAGEAVVATIGRVLLVPPNTEAFWFLVYPKQIAFLGPAYTWNTNIDIIRQTALAATGDVFSANASFIAVGWSGLGFLGVLLNGVALLFYVHLIEVAFSQNITPYLRNLILALFAVPLFFLLSGTVGDFLFKGGLTPLLIAWNLPLSSRKGGYFAHSLLNSLQLKS